MSIPSTVPWQSQGIDPSATTLLVIDDTVTNLKVVSKILSDQGFRVLLASRPEVGLERAARGLPDLILLDILMPGMDGFETYERLRQDERTCDIPVIYMTALTDTEHKVRGLNLGAVDYITKPINHDELLARLCLHLRLRLLNRRLTRLVDERTRALVEVNESLKAEIEEHQQTALSLIEARHVAESADRAKGRFLANMSHELRTPLNAVVGMTELLGSTELSGEQQAYLDTIQVGSQMMRALVGDILDMSRLEFQATHLERISFDLHHCVESTLDIVAKNAADKGLELTADIDARVPQVVFGDPGRLHQVLVNLLGNAVKFTPAGEVAVSVEVRSLVTRENERARRVELLFTVRDTGIGMTADEAERVFAPFVQADVSTTRKYGGTGLGLAICRRLVELMRGRIWVESQVQRGSRFYFTAQVEIAEPDPSLSLAEDGYGEALRGKHLLVVAAHPTARAVVDNIARAWGMRVTAAAPSAELAARLHAGQSRASIDVALVDAAAAWAIDGLSPSAPTVAMVAMRPREAQAVESRFVARIGKPIKRRALRRALIRAVHPGADIGRADEISRDSDLRAHEGLGGRAPLRILVAEDNALNQRVLDAMFRRLDYEIDLVGTGARALDAVKNSRYDLVLMDLQMPEMDGIQATRLIRAQVPGELQPYIVALTASASSEVREMCRDAGMDHYLNKPFSSSNLIALLEERWAATRS